MQCEVYRRHGLAGPAQPSLSTQAGEASICKSRAKNDGVHDDYIAHSDLRAQPEIREAS